MVDPGFRGARSVSRQIIFGQFTGEILPYICQAYCLHGPKDGVIREKNFIWNANIFQTGACLLRGGIVQIQMVNRHFLFKTLDPQ